METLEKIVPKIRRSRGRPPKDEAGFNDTREILLRAGIEILTEKGFSTTGIDEVLRRVAIPKGSFYHYFSSKEVFGGELINRYAIYLAQRLDRFLLDDSLAPLQRLQAFLDDAQIAMARYDYKRGCMIGNLGQEMGALPEAYRTHLTTVLNDWQTRVQHCLQAAQAAGEISSETDCQKLAAYFWIGWEGAVLRAKLESNASALMIFSEYFFAGLAR